MEHQHQSAISTKTQVRLAIAVLITLGFACVEYYVGLISNSLALMADSAHMAVDSIGLLLAFIAAYLSTKPATNTFTYGFGRIQMLAALINLILLSVVIIHILVDAFHRFSNTLEVNIHQMAPVALFGLIINVVIYFVLRDKNSTTNMKAAQLHVLGDMIGSMGALVGAAIIYFTQWHIVDPIVSIFICIILTRMTVKLAKRVLHQATDGVPPGIDIEDVTKVILACDDTLVNIHDIHIWQSCDKYISLTAHVETTKLNSEWNNILYKIHTDLIPFNITHITIQPEFMGGYCNLMENIKEESHAN